MLWRPITCGCAETTAPLLVEVLDGRVLEVEELLFDVIVTCVTVRPSRDCDLDKFSQT